MDKALAKLACLLVPGEAHLQDPELVGSPRDLEGHEIRLAAILGRHPQAPAREASSLSSRRASG